MISTFFIKSSKNHHNSGQLRPSQSQSNIDYINGYPDDVYRVHRQTSSLDNLGGGFLLKRDRQNRPLDTLGGGYLLGKRGNIAQGQQRRGAALDSLGGGYLL